MALVVKHRITPTLLPLRIPTRLTARLSRFTKPRPGRTRMLITDSHQVETTQADIRRPRRILTLNSLPNRTPMVDRLVRLSSTHNRPPRGILVISTTIIWYIAKP